MNHTSKSTYVAKPQTASAADWSDVAELQKRLAECAENLANMTADVGAARTVIEYDSDRRKRALAKAMMGPLNNDESAAAAEAIGRSSEVYIKELGRLADQLEGASAAIAAWDAEKIRWETARSLLSMVKAQVGQL